MQSIRVPLPVVEISRSDGGRGGGSRLLYSQSQGFRDGVDEFGFLPGETLGKRLNSSAASLRDPLTLEYLFLSVTLILSLEPQ